MFLPLALFCLFKESTSAGKLESFRKRDLEEISKQPCVDSVPWLQVLSLMNMST